MNAVFEQGGGMDLNGAATSGGLTCEFGLHFWPDVNGNGQCGTPNAPP